MDSKLHIRDYTMNDIIDITNIYNEAIVKQNATMDDEIKKNDYMENLVKGFNSRETILILENKSYIIGWGIIKRYSDRKGYYFCCETSVYLRQSQKRKGYGSLIKEALIERCNEYNYHHIVAKIFANNKASIEYNKQYGYSIVGIQKEIGYKKGKWQDIVIMQLLLKTKERGENL